MEKYGRVLADIYLDDLHVNEYMIRQKYAYKYNGGKNRFIQNLPRNNFYIKI